MEDGLIPPAGSPTPEAIPPSVEQTPAAPSMPEQVPPTPERHGEQLPSPEATRASAGLALPPIQPPVVSDDATYNQAKKAKVAKAKLGTTPDLAEDVDMIEMAWVNKAKEIIDHTKDDPHAQEAQVEQLQRDYLKKRYGKEMKAAG